MAERPRGVEHLRGLLLPTRHQTPAVRPPVTWGSLRALPIRCVLPRSRFQVFVLDPSLPCDTPGCTPDGPFRAPNVSVCTGVGTVGTSVYETPSVLEESSRLPSSEDPASGQTKVWSDRSRFLFPRWRLPSCCLDRQPRSRQKLPMSVPQTKHRRLLPKRPCYTSFASAPQSHSSDSTSFVGPCAGGESEGTGVDLVPGPVPRLQTPFPVHGLCPFFGPVVVCRRPGWGSRQRSGRLPYTGPTALPHVVDAPGTPLGHGVLYPTEPTGRSAVEDGQVVVLPETRVFFV